jgi:hypothetical protein
MAVKLNSWGKLNNLIIFVIIFTMLYKELLFIPLLHMVYYWLLRLYGTMKLMY